MNCQEYKNMIEDALDYSLHGELGEIICRHLEHCPECRCYLAMRRQEHSDLFMSINGAYSHPRPPPDDFTERLITAATVRRPMPFFLRMPRWALVAASVAIAFIGIAFAGVAVERVISSIREEAAANDVPEAEAPRETSALDTAPGGSCASQDSILEEVARPEQPDVAYAIPTTKTQQTKSETSNDTPNASTQNKGNEKMNIRKTTTALAAAFALAAGGAQAGSTTYYQPANDCSSVISLDGLPSNTEITSTPQLAFPGIKLDDIPERASFFTTSYGPSINNPGAICVGMHETRHYDGEGKCDKLALQCAVYDGVDKNHMYTKCVIIVLTNGAGGDGVYVQRVAQCYTSNWYAQTKFYTMNNSTGAISSANSPSGWSTTATDYQLAGLRIHGLSVAASGKAKGLAFPGVTLADIKDCAFVAGYRSGKAMEVPAANNVATHVEAWPDSTNPQKLVMQFTHPTASYKTAVIQLTNGVDGVYAFQSHHAYNVNAKRFSINSETGAVSATGGSNNNNQWQTSDDPPNYPVHDLFLLPPCVKKTATKIWSGVTLADIEHGEFTARFSGVSGQSAGTIFIPDSAIGCNKKLRYDNNGNLTNLVIEFQTQHGGSVRGVVVSFTDDGSDVYATGLGARYANGTVGNYEFYKENGTITGTSIDFADTHTGNYYGVCDLRVTVPIVWTLDQNRTWSELRNGETLAPDEIVCIRVTDSDAVLTIDENVNVEWIKFVDGSGATLQVNSGYTVTAESISGIGNILNNGTLVKTGDGTASMPFNIDSTGITVVSNGTLKVASVTGTGTSHTIRVKSGATFDLNGYAENVVSVILEGGANFVNSRADIGINKQQTKSITLEGDATATATYTFRLLGPGYSGTTLTLGSNILVLNGAKEFTLCNTTITGDGTISVTKGRLCTRERDSTGADCTISIGANGIFENNMHFTVKNFLNNGTIDYASSWGRGVLEVTGEFSSKTASFPKLTLIGATVKAMPNAVVTVLNNFNASGIVTIDASEIAAADLRNATDGRIPLLTVPSKFNTASANWNLYSPNAGGHLFWSDETHTLYLCKPTGLKISVR